MKLYEIDEEILGCVDAETGEIFDEEKFESLSLERDTKVENLALWVKELKAEAEALKNEKMAFAERQKSVESKMNSVKGFLARYLDGAKFKTAKVAVSYRKSTALEVGEGAEIPNEYLRFKEPEINKTELTNALKRGEVFEGVELVEKQNIQIK